MRKVYSPRISGNGHFLAHQAGHGLPSYVGSSGGGLFGTLLGAGGRTLMQLGKAAMPILGNLLTGSSTAGQAREAASDIARQAVQNAAGGLGQLASSHANRMIGSILGAGSSR